MKETAKSPYLSVILPVYNEEENIEYAVAEIVNNLRNIVSTFELLIINDGSSDRTGEIADLLSKKIKEMHTIHHSKNRGPGSGIHTALHHIKGEWVIVIPADLAMDLNELCKYFEVSKYADIVIGNRSDRRDYSIYRKFASLTNIFLIRFLFGMKEHQFNYINLYRSEIFKKIKINSNGVFITAEIIIQARDLKYKLKEIKIQYIPRAQGKGSCGSPKVILKTAHEMLAFYILRKMRYK